MHADSEIGGSTAAYVYATSYFLTSWVVEKIAYDETLGREIKLNTGCGSKGNSSCYSPSWATCHYKNVKEM